MGKFDFEQSLNHHLDVFTAINEETFLEQVIRIGSDMVETIRQGGKIILFGNGGSAAEASHFATELISKCSSDHEPWPAISLSDSSSNLTAIGNDYGFENVFSRQINGLASANDCVIGFSTSGTSENVLRALSSATTIGCQTYLMTGSNYNHNNVNKWSYLVVPSMETTKIQEVHLWLIHALSEYCEENI